MGARVWTTVIQRTRRTNMFHSLVRLLQTIKETMAELIPARQEYAKMLKTEHGDKSLGEIKVDQVRTTPEN